MHSKINTKGKIKGSHNSWTCTFKLYQVSKWSVHPLTCIYV